MYGDVLYLVVASSSPSPLPQAPLPRPVDLDTCTWMRDWPYSLVCQDAPSPAIAPLFPSLLYRAHLSSSIVQRPNTHDIACVKLWVLDHCWREWSNVWQKSKAHIVVISSVGEGD